jgi:hypothetical protein
MYCLEGSWLVRLLSLDLAILLDVDVIVGLEDTDFVFWEVDTIHRGQFRYLEWSYGRYGKLSSART